MKLVPKNKSNNELPVSNLRPWAQYMHEYWLVIHVDYVKIGIS